MRASEFLELQNQVTAFDLASYVVSRGFTRLNEDEWINDCPKCGKEKKLTVNVTRRGWHCWVCEAYERDPGAKKGRKVVRGAGGVLRLIRWLEDCSFADAVALVAKTSYFDAKPIDSLPVSALLVEVLDEVLTATPMPAPEGWAPFMAPHWYLERRGITPQDVQSYGLFQCLSGKYAHRLILPVFERGVLIYWQTRALYDRSDLPPDAPFVKALNPPRAPGFAVSSDVLMNLEQAACFPRVAITEGPISAIRTGPDAVCTFGKRISPAQVARLLRAGVRAVDLLWDGPSPTEPSGALPEMLAAAPFLATFFDVRVVMLPHGDPAEHPREAVQFWRERAAPADQLSTIARLP